MKIVSVVGARPNFMKIAPIARAILEHNDGRKNPLIEHLIVHTGQHYDDLMSSLFFQELELPKPNINLGVGSGSHAVQTAKIMKRFEPVLLQEQPDVLLVVGDVNSTIASTLVASKTQYHRSAKRSRPVIAHVEAGLRSFDRTMPEEINRVLTDALSDLLFVTEEDARKNLEREGIPRNKIHFVGNVMIDTLIRYSEKARRFQTLDTLGLMKGNHERRYGIVTLHRPSNVDDPNTLGCLIECMALLAQRLPLIFPLHPRTRNNLERFGLDKRLGQNKNIFLIQPLGYLEFLNLLLAANVVLTDSGGIQEEATFLRVPCVTLRYNTERPVTVRLGTNYLVGTDSDKIMKTIYNILDGKGKRGTIPPLWDGYAGKRIVDTIIQNVEDI